MVRPQRMRLGGELQKPGIINHVSAAVVAVHFSGETIHISAQAGDWNFVVEMSNLNSDWRAVQPGSEITVEWDPSDTLAFAGSK